MSREWRILYLRIREDVFEKLKVVAARDFRIPKQEASFLLEQAIERAYADLDTEEKAPR